MKSKKLRYVLTLVVILVISYCLNNSFQNSQTTNQTTRAQESSFLELLPTSTTAQVVHHQYYSLSYSEKHEQAEWVAYQLKESHLSRNQYNRPYFEIDKAVKTKAAHWKNYKKSGYSKGHLCPAADRAFSETAYQETFLTSNIAPQKQEFNAGIWNTLEQKVRYWAKRKKVVYVITGGVLTNSLPSIGKEKVSVPKYFYKIVFDYNAKDKKAIAFLIPHQQTDVSIYKFVTTIDKIEALTGIDFFPELDDTIEDTLEATANYKQWLF